jgi:type IV fimbrial biogenesis protein FimT
MARHYFGATLTELLIVVAIVAILGMSAAPSLGDFITNSRVLTQANALLAALHQARSRALGSNEPWTLCLSDDGESCKAGRSGRARGWLLVPLARADEVGVSSASVAGLAGIASGLIPSELALHGSRFRLTYWPYSRSGTTGTLTVCPATAATAIRARQIIVSQTGRPRLKILGAGSPCPA